MTLTEWAQFALKYLRQARRACHDDFNALMNELRESGAARGEDWYPACKNTIPILYHYTSEFVDDIDIPGTRYSSPADVHRKVDEFRGFVQGMVDQLVAAGKAYEKSEKLEGYPFLVTATLQRAGYLMDAVDHVIESRPSIHSQAAAVGSLEQIVTVATRFHESVLSLKDHPHGGTPWSIMNEWDCQYLFRSILVSIIPDVRQEEWNPSFAGSSARCEFLLKAEKILVELKYVRKASDQKKLKTELSSDLFDYGANSEVDYVVFLIYDPQSLLKSPIPLQTDFSGPAKGLKDVRVVITPPRL